MQEGVGKRLEEPSIWKVLGLETENPVPDELNKEDSGDGGGAYHHHPKDKADPGRYPVFLLQVTGSSQPGVYSQPTLPLPGSAHGAFKISRRGRPLPDLTFHQRPLLLPTRPCNPSVPVFCLFCFGHLPEHSQSVIHLTLTQL